MSLEEQSRGQNTYDQAAIERLVELAQQACETAYAPYSGFRVGAAILRADGQYFAASNVENASYGLTLCAERNVAVAAINASYAVTSTSVGSTSATAGSPELGASFGGDRLFTALAIYTPTEKPTAPCGACRQVLYEFAPELWLVSTCESSQRLQVALSDLLPHAFGPSSL